MKRRDVLTSLGGLTAAGIAGCVAGRTAQSPNDGSDPDNTTDTRTTTDPPNTDDPTTTPDDGTGWGPETEAPFETLTIGTRDGVPFPDNNRPHVVRVWNGADETRTMTLSMHGKGDVVLERTFQFPADGWVKLTLNEPAAYEVAIAIDDRDAGTVTVDRTWFDCNDAITNVAVNAEGAVDSTTVSTAVACPGPTIADTSFTQRDGQCGTGGNADVEFRDEAVQVTGAIKTPTPCYDLALESATLEKAETHDDGPDDVLVVTITTDGQRGEACTDCIGEVSYEATVAFENEYPSNVRVVHSSMGDRRTVRDGSDSVRNPANPSR